MKYIFAYDGGGTKTRINVIDLQGNILFDKTSSGSNIFSIGRIQFTKVIEGLYIEAKEELAIKDADISLVYLGLSGADLDEDYIILNEACDAIFKDVSFVIQNDAWIIMRSGLTTPYGAVCICGTGTNSAAINKKGNRAILRSLSYTLGTRGGGLDIARDALHYAFRADELTYKDTMLKTKIPELLGLNSIADVIPLFYPENLIDKVSFGSITGTVDDCALMGDEVSIMILEDVAKHIALQTIGVMRQVKIDKEEVPIVIGGRVFTLQAKIFMDTFKTVIKKEAPNARIILPTFTPVVGAYLSALDELDIKQTKEIETNLLESGGSL